MNRVDVTLTAGVEAPCQIGPCRFWKIQAVPSGAVITGRVEKRTEPGVQIPLSNTTQYQCRPEAEDVFDLRLSSTVSGVVTVIYSMDEHLRDNEMNINAGNLPFTVRPSVSGVTAAGDATLATVTAADVSLSVASSVSIYRVRASLDPTAPGGVRVSAGASASATRGLWLMPGETLEFFKVTRTIVGNWALSFYNPNPVDVNVDTQTETV